MSNETTTADGGVRKKGKLGQRIAYACGNLGQSAFYNAMSTYFIVYVTGCLFSGVDKALAAKLIGVITSLVVIIRIAEIFIDPLLGNLIDNTNTKWGRFRPWQFFGGLISAVLLAVIFSGMFGLVNVNTTLFIVLFVITFVVLDVFYSLRDISYWGMIPALSSDSHERSTYTALGSFTGSIGYNGITVGNSFSRRRNSLTSRHSTIPPTRPLASINGRERMDTAALLASNSESTAALPLSTNGSVSSTGSFSCSSLVPISLRYSPCMVLTDPKRRKQLMAFGDAYRTMPSTVSTMKPSATRALWRWFITGLRYGNWPRGIISYSCLPALMLSDS